MKTHYSKNLDSIPPSGIRRFFDLIGDSENILSLGIGEPHFGTPECIKKAGIRTLEKGITSYTSNNGLLALREEITNYLSRRFSIHYSPKNEIIITTGVSEGADIALRAILNPDDEVIFPDPGYVCYPALIALAGGKCISVDTSETDFIPTKNAIQNAITSKTKAIILCSPSNPTGAVIPKKRLVEIASLAKEHDLWIISDEIYAELTFDAPYTSIASIPEMKERTIVLSGFSKAFSMTGWRLGYIAGPESIVTRTLKIHQYATLCAPIMAQYAGIEALQSALSDVKRMTAFYKERRNQFITGLREIGYDVGMPSGAFYCFPSIKKTNLSSEDFCIALLQEEKLATVPGSAFGKFSEGFIRCCYATTKDVIDDALNRLNRFYKNHT